MLKMWKLFIKNLKRALRFCLGLALNFSVAKASHGQMPINDTKIRLLDGRTIQAIRCGVHCHCLVVKQDLQTLSKRCYQEEFDRLWDYAFFVPVKPGQYSIDINKDGAPEVGVATWDGGNNIDDRYAIVFTIRGDKLYYLEKRNLTLNTANRYIHKQGTCFPRALSPH